MKYLINGYSSKSGSVEARKHMKIDNQKELDEAMHKWYVQQKACGTKVTSESIWNACEQLSKHLGIECSVSDGWLWHFCNQDGLHDLQVRGEALSVDTAAGEVYWVQLNELIKKGFLWP